MHAYQLELLIAGLLYLTLSIAMQEATTRIRNAIRARYVLLPYIYTLFRHANTTGQPLMRPLWFDFPDVPATYAVEDEFLLGPALLVGAPGPHLARLTTAPCLWIMCDVWKGPPIAVSIAGRPGPGAGSDGAQCLPARCRPLV